ncbi:hypothetical protein U1Q18_036828, partial [Sarracenia purpurea var. burkii]
ATLRRMHFTKNSDGIWVKAPSHPSIKSSVTHHPPAPSDPAGPSSSTLPVASAPTSAHSIPTPPSADIPSSTPTAPSHTPASTSAPAISDPAVLARLDAMDASNLAFQTRVLKDLESLKKAQIHSSKVMTNMQAFMDHFMPKHIPLPFPSLTHGLRPQGTFPAPASATAPTGQGSKAHAAPPAVPPAAQTSATPVTDTSAPVAAQVQKSAAQQSVSSAPAPLSASELFEREREKVNKLLAGKGIQAIPPVPEPSVPTTKPPSPPTQTGQPAAPTAPVTDVEEPAPAAKSDSDDDLPISTKLKTFKNIEKHLQGLIGSNPILDPLTSASSAPAEAIHSQTQLLFPMPISAVPFAPAPSQVSMPVILPPKEGSPTKAYTRKKKGLQTHAVKGKGKGTMDPPKDPNIALMDAIIAE